MVLNQIARILFLKRQYAEAVDALKQVAAVDPEDLQMHYTWMLCCRGLGDAGDGRARREALPPLQGRGVVAGHHRHAAALLSPEDNNERQPIHDHESAVEGDFR